MDQMMTTLDTFTALIATQLENPMRPTAIEKSIEFYCRLSIQCEINFV